METKINPNQINSEPIKVLNVVQTGTLTRDGAVFSGFSNNNYLDFGARIDKGILSLDNTTYIKNTKAILSSPYEIGISLIAYGGGTDFISQGDYIGGLQFGINGQMHLSISVESTYTVSDFTFDLNKKYFVKIVYDTTNYKGYVSETGFDDMTLVLTSSFGTTPTRNSNLFLGYYKDYSWNGEIDIANTYIKINGEYWWKGVETL